MRSLKVAGLFLGAFLMVALPAGSAVRLQGAFVAGGWYGPPVYGPYGNYPPPGEVKLKTNVKDADVFINGAFAGKAGKLKSIWLRPDAYSLELRAPGRASYAERIYVIPGRAIKVQADLPPCCSRKFPCPAACN
jgi:hypothetical protein